MRSYIFVVLFLLPLPAFTVDYSLDRLILGLRAKFRQKCISIGGEKAFYQLQLAVSNLLDCIPIDFNSPDTICTEQRSKSYQCYMDFFVKLELCLEVQEKYIKDFFLGTHYIMFEKLCIKTNKHLLQPGNIEDMICGKPLDEIVQEYFQNCLPHLKIVQNLYKHNDVITKEDLCVDILILRNCHFINKEDYDYCGANFIKDLLNIVLESYLATCGLSSKV